MSHRLDGARCAHVLDEPHQTLVAVHETERVERRADAQQLVLVLLSRGVVYLVRRGAAGLALLVRRDVTLEAADLAEIPARAPRNWPSSSTTHIVASRRGSTVKMP